MRYYHLIISVFVFTLFGKAQEQHFFDQKRMQRFVDARLGVFFHRGIYAVDGIDKSCSFFNQYISYDDNMKQSDGFNASKYDPQA